MACAYCYVPRHKGYATPITVFTNIEQITGHLRRHVARQGLEPAPDQVDPVSWVYDIGENSDCSVDPLVSDNVADPLVATFRELPTVKASFATTFVNRQLLDLDPRGRTRVRFSLMPDADSGREADWTALLRQLDDELSPATKEQAAAEVIMLTHNRELHEVNLGWHPKAEALLRRPDLQQPERSQNGQLNVRYRNDVRRAGVQRLSALVARHAPWLRIRHGLLMRLSLLDRSRTRAGEPDAAALTGTVERAVHAERLGYDRIWVAEHHGVPGVAGAAPAVLLAAIAGGTSSIRLGSAGVMLPHHQPLVVAEQFGTLSAFAPGRVDLGLGRSPGFTPPVRRALRETERDFAADLAELRAQLAGTAEITAHPRPAAPVPMYVLATGAGLEVAAALGLPVVVGGPLLGVGGDPEPGREALARYRRAYRPSAQSPEPWIGISLDVLVADAAAEAADLLLPEAWAMARARTTGTFPPLQPVAEVKATAMTATQRRYAERTAAMAVAGTADRVAARLVELAERTGADELVASGSTSDRAALAASDVALARLLR